MRERRALYVGAVAVLCTLITPPASEGGCVPHDGNSIPPTACCQQVGPDIIVGDIQEATNYPPDPIAGPTHDAFSYGTTSCNVGDVTVEWDADTSKHPVIGQNLFKLKNGRFEQIGMSWLKHGFAALTEDECGCGCQSPGTSQKLGVGCSDPYNATRNGQQSNLGPHWQVNAHTGVFTYPPANPPLSGSTARRLRVALADLEPSSGSVLYFAEAQYVTFDDALAENGNNNASYRPVNMITLAGDFATSLAGTTKREQPGVRAWQDTDPTVVETDIQILNEGLFILAAKATDLGKGMWHYEYALQNLNSDRSGGSFTVSLLDGVTVTNIGFHDVDYHSFDGIPDTGGIPRNFDGTDWQVTQRASSLRWSTAHMFKNNPNANALRWGTLYNFRFDADRPPIIGKVSLGLFKPGTPASVSAESVIPGPLPCPADIAGGKTGGDGVVNVTDLLAVIQQCGACPQPCPPRCSADIVPTTGDCTVNVSDLLAVIGAWGPCP